jgi:hypothetical protein
LEGLSLRFGKPLLRKMNTWKNHYRSDEDATKYKLVIKQRPVYSIYMYVYV